MLNLLYKTNYVINVYSNIHDIKLFSHKRKKFTFSEIIAYTTDKIVLKNNFYIKDNHNIYVYIE